MIAPIPAKHRGTGGTRGTALQEKDLSGSPTENGAGNPGNPPALVAIAPDEIPAEMLQEEKIERPVFQTHDGKFRLDEQEMRAGLYWHGYGKRDREGERPEVDVWICSPIHAEAITSGEAGDDWGLLLRFLDPRGRWKEWAAPMRLLKGSADDLRGELLDMGVRIDRQNRDRLTEWMMSRYPKRRIIAASRTGWHETPSGRCFVLPGRTIGAEDVRFQAEHIVNNDFTAAGTLDGWREHVGAMCEGNPILLLAVSAAFAGPLLKVAKLQSVGGAGIHLVGDSSRGKTTALQVAGSAWGAPEFVRTWRATANGMEATAGALNDTLLALDEISECDPREIGAVVYSLANGTGKQRAARTGGSRATARWRIMALSSGERTLAAHMSEGGRRAKAGQEARLLNLPATNRRCGAFDDLHGHADGRAFANALKQASGANYGLAGPQFVRHVLQDLEDGRDLPALLAECEGSRAFSVSDGLEMRAAGVFVLCGMAGELATEYGLTGWTEGAASKAAAELFAVWREFRGAGDTESRHILRGVRDFILAHGDSRFSPLEGELSAIGVRERAGYWKADTDGRIYYFTSAGLREAATGYDISRILEAIDKAGWIVERDTDRPNRRSKKVNIRGGGRENLYVIRPDEEEDDGRS